MVGQHPAEVQDDIDWIPKDLFCSIFDIPVYAFPIVFLWYGSEYGFYRKAAKGNPHGAGDGKNERPDLHPFRSFPDNKRLNPFGPDDDERLNNAAHKGWDYTKF